MNRNVLLVAAILFGIVVCGIVALIRPLHASESIQMQYRPAVMQNAVRGR